jgi:signal transduction histidine kinase
MLELHAKVWESQLHAVENERQALAHLGHEMRTPLQSAKTSLALLADQLDGTAAFERLRRAVARLVRASNAALWLATDRIPDWSTQVPALALVRDLVQELRPIAQLAGQTIEIDVSNEVHFHAPPEIAETILANLLLNTIQHGAPGRVGIYGRDDVLTITNFTESEGGSAGFGLGLEIARRLGRVVGWNITVSRSEASVHAHIDLSLPTTKAVSPRFRA